MSIQPKRRNIYLTDENVDGPAIRLARLKYEVQILRDVDLDIPCDIDDYDQCLFEYAMEHGYILVTANIKDFEWRYYEYAETHETPGIIFIQANYNRSSELIADWLGLWEEEDFTNRIGRIPPSY
jgi:hypothetical protein